MDYFDLLNKFAGQYVSDLKQATDNGDWDCVMWVKRDAKRIVRDMNKVIASVDFLTGLGITIK